MYSLNNVHKNYYAYNHVLMQSHKASAYNCIIKSLGNVLYWDMLEIAIKYTSKLSTQQKCLLVADVHFSRVISQL